MQTLRRYSQTAQGPAPLSTISSLQLRLHKLSRHLSLGQLGQLLFESQPHHWEIPWGSLQVCIVGAVRAIKRPITLKYRNTYPNQVSER